MSFKKFKERLELRSKSVENIEEVSVELTEQECEPVYVEEVILEEIEDEAVSNDDILEDNEVIEEEVLENNSDGEVVSDGTAQECNTVVPEDDLQIEEAISDQAVIIEEVLPSISFEQHMKNIDGMLKMELDKYATSHGIELDRRQSRPNMIKEFITKIKGEE